MSQEQVFATVEEATAALTGDADYTTPVGQPKVSGQYEQMESANPLPREEFAPDVFEGKEGLRRAAEEVVARRTPTKDELQAAAPVEVSYREKDTGRIKPPHEVVVSKEQAAHDLSTFRETLQQQEQSAADEVLRALVDGERGVQTTEAIGAEPQQQQTQPDGQQETPQPDQAALESDAKQKLEQALSDPFVLSAIQEEVQRVTAQEQAKSAAALNQYAQATYANATMAAQNLVANFGELSGLTADQLPIAIQTIARTNPERGRAIVEHVGRVQNLLSEAQRANYAQQQMYQQAQQQQFTQWSAQQDDAYSAWADKQASANERKAIEDEARQMIMDEYRANTQQVTAAWNTNPTLRSFQSQKFLFAAARDRLARKNINHKRDRTPPVVQRPGAGSVEIASAQDQGLKALSDKIGRTTGRDQIRAAAELVAARRARR